MLKTNCKICGRVLDEKNLDEWLAWEGRACCTKHKNTQAWWDEAVERDGVNTTTVVFDDQEVLRVEKSGEIYVYQQLVTTDREIGGAFTAWLCDHNKKNTKSDPQVSLWDQNPEKPEMCFNLGSVTYAAIDSEGLSNRFEKGITPEDFVHALKLWIRGSSLE